MVSRMHEVTFTVTYEGRPLEPWVVWLTEPFSNPTEGLRRRAGLYRRGRLNTTPVDAQGDPQPSLWVTLPCVDDPENVSETGFHFVLTVGNAADGDIEETYHLYPTVAQALMGDPVDLDTYLLPGDPDADTPGLLLGGPGGVAVLDLDGDVLNGRGEKVLGLNESGEIDLSNYYTRAETDTVVAEAAPPYDFVTEFNALVGN